MLINSTEINQFRIYIQRTSKASCGEIYIARTNVLFINVNGCLGWQGGCHSSDDQGNLPLPFTRQKADDKIYVCEVLKKSLVQAMSHRELKN